MDFSVFRKSRLSGPQLQAQLSRLTDRTRLRRLKDTLLSKGAWQQVTRIEGLVSFSKSPTHGSTTWTPGSVLTPHDYVPNIQKRLCNKLWQGDGQCRRRGSFLDLHLEHAETELADPDITRGRAASQSRRADIFTTAAVPGRSAALDVCVPLPLQRQLAEMLHRRHSAASWRTTGMNSELAWTADGRPHPAVTRTLRDAADITSSRNGPHLPAKSLHR